MYEIEIWTCLHLKSGKLKIITWVIISHHMHAYRYVDIHMMLRLFSDTEEGRKNIIAQNWVCLAIWNKCISLNVLVIELCSSGIVWLIMHCDYTVLFFIVCVDIYFVSDTPSLDGNGTYEVILKTQPPVATTSLESLACVNSGSSDNKVITWIERTWFIKAHLTFQSFQTPKRLALWDPKPCKT